MKIPQYRVTNKSIALGEETGNPQRTRVRVFFDPTVLSALAACHALSGFRSLRFPVTKREF
jgi:hypothetical protein